MCRTMASKKTSTKPLVGFIGQGFIGKSYADDLEKRGYPVVRYALEEPYRGNKENIQDCDIVFIAVPTPTTPKGFDFSIVRDSLKLVRAGATVVIKSTLLPGTTATFQKKFPKLFIMHSPEFLVARSASTDAAKPARNIIGIPKKSAAFVARANEVLAILPKAPFSLVCSSEEAEIVKYAGNAMLYLRVLLANMLYDTARAAGADYEVVRAAIAADPRIGPSHLQVIHDSGHKGAKKGRGAGGLCFIKDVAAFTEFYGKRVGDEFGVALFDAAMRMNANLLMRTGKDLDLLEGVHGAAFLRSLRKGKKKR
jgi:nucleotide sugar dehydrogenase